MTQAARTAFVSISASLLAACAGDDDSGGGAPPPANAAPVITSPANAAVDENTSAAAYTATATDADGDAIAFSLGGADAAQFSIGASTGEVRFNAPPDFEAPADAGGDNTYDITVRASDGAAQANLAVAIAVRDVSDNFQVRRLVTGLTQPLFVTGAGDGSGRLFIAQKGGLIRIADAATGALNAAPFLNVSASISTTGERGLLGLAFAPDYAASGLFYIFVINTTGDVEIRRYSVSVGDPDIADPASMDVVYAFDQTSFGNHKAGWIGFGPDGFLYIASGDGGGNTTASNPAQDTSSPLGKILRIDLSTDGFPADPLRDYAIPPGNPFAAGGGLPEVYAYGLRNPFRASFDAATGVLIIGDVGEGAREEVDIIPPGTGGQNFGWVRFEGTEVFNASATAPGALPPVLQYAHGTGPYEGGSITGGVVNRGPVEALEGEYIFGDFVSARIWSVPAANLVQGTTIAAAQYSEQTNAFAPDVGAIGGISSFGTDDEGNVYIVELAGGEIFRFEAQ